MPILKEELSKTSRYQIHMGVFYNITEGREGQVPGLVLCADQEGFQGEEW